ncbi:MAG: hypothetical protein ACFFBY_02040, partial [Promethearchaeota archaeon]
MKLNAKTKILISITLAFLCVLLTIVNENSNIIPSFNQKSPKYDFKKLKRAQISGRIHINNNWTA